MSIISNLRITGENIRLVREREQMKQFAFARRMGISRELLNKIENGKSAISAKRILWLRDHYPYDFGEVLPYKSKNAASLMNEERHGYEKGFPVFENHLSAALITQFKEHTAPQPAFYLGSSQFTDCTLAALAKGDHAMTSVRNGDTVICREVTDYEFIDYSSIYFVAGKNGLEMYRYVHPHVSDPDVLLLKSDRQDDPPSPMRKEFIAHLFQVRGFIRGF